MRLKTNILILIFATIVFFGGCSKNIEEYNKPAAYWYAKLIESVADQNLEKADNYYSSLQGEHIGSPLLPEATMILSIAHMHFEEYLLSEHFSNEYIKRYANANEREFLDYMKIRAKYMALPNPRRDQVLIQEAIKEGQIFKNTYPDSMYYAIVDTMVINLKMAEAALHEAIADLYMRIDKPRSAEYYRNIKPQTWMNWEEIDRANTPWYREWFEGDGTGSWYAFLIPDTQSVVSRNTVAFEEYEKETEVLDESSSEEKTQTQKLLDSIKTKEEIDDTKKELSNTKEEAKEEIKKLSKMQEYELKRTRELMEKGVLSKEDYEEIKKEIQNNR
jgi:outer membrane protein assembly factor BamD